MNENENTTTEFSQQKQKPCIVPAGMRRMMEKLNALPNDEENSK